MNLDTTLTGKVALVTGSGRGLGFAIAARLAELGARVAVHDIDQNAPAEFGEFPNLDAAAAKIGGYAVTGDIADEAVVAGFVADIEKTLGPIDILVNCAGGDIAAKGGKPKPNDALNIPVADIRAMFDRNLIGTMLVCRAVCPGMIERRRGSVIHIGSTAAHVGVEDGVAYAVAKAGVVHWSLCLARELRPHGIRVNVVSPGPTQTARFVATRTVDPAKMDPDAVSLDRYAVPREIADAVAFLASDSARFLSGQILRVDGGLQLFSA